MEYQVKGLPFKIKGVEEYIIMSKKMNDEDVGSNIVNMCNY
ncbi:hypothetical protein [Flavobacterium sp. LB2P6]